MDKTLADVFSPIMGWFRILELLISRILSFPSDFIEALSVPNGSYGGLFDFD